MPGTVSSASPGVVQGPPGAGGETAAPDRPNRLPSGGASIAHRVPRRPRELGAEDVLVALGCAFSSVSACWLIFDRLTEGTGWFGFLLVAYLGFVSLFYVVTTERLGRLVAVDRTITVGVWSAALVVLVPLCGLVLYIIVKGLPGLSLNFFTHDMRGVSPLEPATSGGGLAAIVGTLEEVGLALAFSVPLAMGTAVFLNETRSRWRRPVRIFVDAMSGKPSIVAGLFIYAVFILPFAGHSTVFGFNGLMAALALSLTMMPTVARTVEVVLRVVPGGLREAGLAMGSSHARVVWSVVLPTARSGIATAVVLGIARTAGETAPLLWTSFGTTLFNANPVNGPQDSLPLYIYSFIREPLANPIQRGETAALVLMGLVLLLFVIARFLGRDRTVARRRGLVGRWFRNLEGGFIDQWLQARRRRRRISRQRSPLETLVFPTTGKPVVVVSTSGATASYPGPRPSVVILPPASAPTDYYTSRALDLYETELPVDEAPSLPSILPFDWEPPLEWERTASPPVMTELVVDDTPSPPPVVVGPPVVVEPTAVVEPTVVLEPPVEDTSSPRLLVATSLPDEEPVGPPASAPTAAAGQFSGLPPDAPWWPWRHIPGTASTPRSEEGSK
jgi:phosphate transport system permease protein